MDTIYYVLVLASVMYSTVNDKPCTQMRCTQMCGSPVMYSMCYPIIYCVLRSVFISVLCEVLERLSGYCLEQLMPVVNQKLIERTTRFCEKESRMVAECCVWTSTLKRQLSLHRSIQANSVHSVFNHNYRALH